LEGEEAGGDVDQGVLHAGGGFEEEMGFAASPEFVERDWGGEDLFDAEAGIAEEVLGGVAGVEVEVGAVEGSAVHVGKLAGEEHHADGEVGDVGQGDDEDGVVGGGGAEAAEGGEGVGKMFEDVGADDGVVSFCGEVGIFDGGGEDVAVKGAGALDRLGIGFDGIDGEIGALEQAAEESLGGADIENRLGAELAKKACNLLMAASGVFVQPVVQHAISSGGRVRI